MSRSPHFQGRQRRPYHPPQGAPVKPLAPQFLPDEQSLQASSGLSPFSYVTEPDPATDKASTPINDEFLVIEREFPHHPAPVNAFIDHHKALSLSGDLVLRDAIKRHYPHLCLTVCSDYHCDILSYAALGKVFLKPNTRKDLSFLTQSVFSLPGNRSDGPGTVRQILDFGCFDVVTRSGHKFIQYYASYSEGWDTIASNYFLHDHQSKDAVQELILEACAWNVELHDEILVFEGGWFKDHKLWESVQKASWDDVILDEKMKKDLIGDVDSFFSSKKLYDDLDVPWKRGLIFHGPPGNGKTISIKALMKNLPYPSLYVKSVHAWGGDEAGIQMIFQEARAMAPCLLILEDLDSLVNSGNRSFFLNEVDGLEENDGILVLATTNHLDQLDPGIVNRPSRFDRKYFFPLPSMEERKKYCKYWQHKLKGNDKVDFPDSLIDKIAKWTDDFSYAYLKEAFISSLLIIAARESHGKRDGDDGDNKKSFETIIKRQIETLRKEMGDGSGRPISRLRI